MPTDLIGIDPRRIPIIGNDIYQVGQVYDILTQPCGVDPVIAVKAAFYYSPTLVWTLLKPDALDLTYDRFRRRHSFRRKKKVTVGELLRGSGVTPGKVHWSVFALGDLAQRLGWYLIILDATTDFAVNWASMAYTWSGCLTPNANYGTFGGQTLQDIEPIFTPYYFPAFSSNADGGTGFSSLASAGINQPGPFSITATTDASIAPFPGQTGVLEKVILRVNFGNGNVVDYDAQIADNPTGGKTATGVIQHWSTGYPSVRVSIGYKWSGGRLNIASGRVQIADAPPPNENGLFADP